MAGNVFQRVFKLLNLTDLFRKSTRGRLPKNSVLEIDDHEGNPIVTVKEATRWINTPVMGNIVVKQEFTGGGENALDSIDGSNLQTGVSALVIKNNICYPYKYVEGATDEENPPYVIAPDTNPNGRWFLNLVNNSDMIDGFHASQSPSANTIPVLNSSGQLWLPFNQTPILVNGQDLMSRIFYVDAVNGDDNNDGSESAPFKTLQKAIDSVPVGGRVIINLKSNYEVLDHSESIWIYSKHVFINLNGYILKTNIDSSGDYNRLRLIFFNKASLLAFYLTGDSQIILDDIGYDSNKGWDSGRRKLVNCSTESKCHTLGRSQLNILAFNMNTGIPFLVIKKGFLMGFVGSTGYYTVDGFDVEIVAWHGESKAIIDDMLIKMHAPVNFHWYVNTVKDSNGNSVNIADKIEGIIKGANGIPRNIVSNIVF